VEFLVSKQKESAGNREQETRNKKVEANRSWKGRERERRARDHKRVQIVLNTMRGLSKELATGHKERRLFFF